MAQSECQHEPQHTHTHTPKILVSIHLTHTSAWQNHMVRRGVFQYLTLTQRRHTCGPPNAVTAYYSCGCSVCVCVWDSASYTCENSITHSACHLIQTVTTAKFGPAFRRRIPKGSVSVNGSRRLPSRLSPPPYVWCSSPRRRQTALGFKWRFSPSVLRPGLEVKLATSTIFTANCWPVSLLMQRRTTLKGPLQHRHAGLATDTHRNTPNLRFKPHSHLPETRAHKRTHQLSATGWRGADSENVLWIHSGWLDGHRLCASGNYRAAVRSAAVKAQLKALLL